jgi:hypothetical protein
MKYNIKVGEKYLIGENIHETLKGTVTGDTTAVYSRFVGEMSAYDFCETADEASDADHDETIVHCKHEENARIIARILDMDEKDTFLVEEDIFGKDAENETPKEEQNEAD